MGIIRRQEGGRESRSKTPSTVKIMSLIKRQFVVSHTISQTEISALRDNLVTDTPSVKTFCPQNNCLSLYPRKKNTLNCWFTADQSSPFCLLQNVCRWVERYSVDVMRMSIRQGGLSEIASMLCE
jgi:hypothetical protein